MRVPAIDVVHRIDEVADGLVRLAMELKAAPSTVLRTVPLPRQAGEDWDGPHSLATEFP